MTDQQTILRLLDIADSLTQTIKRLLEEKEELRKDAERYRWLRDKADYVRLEEGSPQVCLTDEWGCIIGIGEWCYPRGEKLDYMVDKFIEQKD